MSHQTGSRSRCRKQDGRRRCSDERSALASFGRRRAFSLSSTIQNSSRADAISSHSSFFPQELAESLARRKQADEEAAAAPPGGPSLPASRKRQPKAAPPKTETVRDLWKDVDEDDFFGASKPIAVEEEDEDDIDASSTTTKKRERLSLSLFPFPSSIPSLT